MFTGIVEGKGEVIDVQYLGEGRRLKIELPIDLTDAQLGDSINVNGACLTIAEKRGQMIEVDVSPETLQKTTFSGLKEGEKVNLERALQLSSRLGGHIVTGHIDGTGVISERQTEREFLRVKVRVPKSISRYVIQKGSIAVDGISLTVNECSEDEIHMTLIPYTLEKTTLTDKKVGDRVNIEADIIGKYVEKMLTGGSARPVKIDLSFLREHGFIKSE